jgi:hypothetical protein
MKRILLSFLCFLIVSAYAVAQEPQMFVAFQQQVKPSMDAAYQTAVKNLKNSCAQNKSAVTWSSYVFDDNSYIHFVPIKNLADLDKNMFSDLEGKIGKENLGKLWVEMDKCTDTQTSFAVTRTPSLSYILPAAGEENFSNVFYWFPIPGKEAEAEQIAMEWQKLYASKKAVTSMVVYKFAFGSEPGYAIVGDGKGPADFETRVQKTRELLGEEGAKLWAKTLLITKKFDTKTGWYLPDLSYIPATK